MESRRLARGPRPATPLRWRRPRAPAWTVQCLTQECRSAPQDRRLSVKIAREFLAVEIVLQVVFLAGALAHVAQIAVGLEITDHPQPPLARRFAVGLCVQP